MDLSAVLKRSPARWDAAMQQFAAIRVVVILVIFDSVVSTHQRKVQLMLTRLHDVLRLRTNPIIFFSSAAVITLFVLGTILFTDALDTGVSAASDWLLRNLGWFYILGVTAFLVFLIYIAASRYGRAKLGPDDEPPEHSNGAWFAMLFAAGIGSILMFWGVAEPVSHLAIRRGQAPASNRAPSRRQSTR